MKSSTLVDVGVFVILLGLTSLYPWIVDGTPFNYEEFIDDGK